MASLGGVDIEEGPRGGKSTGPRSGHGQARENEGAGPTTDKDGENVKADVLDGAGATVLAAFEVLGGWIGFPHGCLPWLGAVGLLSFHGGAQVRPPPTGSRCVWRNPGDQAC